MSDALDPARGVLRVACKQGRDWKAEGTATALSPGFVVTCAHVLLGHRDWDSADRRSNFENDLRDGDPDVRDAWSFSRSADDPSAGVPAADVWFHPETAVDLALIRLEGDGLDVGAYPLIVDHERALRHDLLPLHFTTCGFSGDRAAEHPGVRVDAGAGEGRIDPSTRMRLEYLLRRGVATGQSGGPLLLRHGDGWVALGIVDLGGRAAYRSGAWSGDALAALLGIADLPDDGRDVFQRLRDVLADDPALQRWLDGEHERHRRMPHLFREGLSHEMADVYRRRLVLQERGKGREEEPGARGGTRDDLASLIAAVRPDRAIVVVGDPGMGKSTLLRHEAFERAGHALSGSTAGDTLLPVFARLPLVMKALDSSATLDDEAARRARVERVIFAAHAGPNEQPVPAALKRRAVRDRIVLLLDGLDEVTVDEPSEIPRTLADVVDRFGARAVVLTTRPAGFVGPGGLRASLSRALDGRLDVASLEPLDPEDRVELVRTLVALKSGERPPAATVEAWLAPLFGEKRTSELGGNPLWLTLQAVMFDPEHPAMAPATLGALVDDAIDALVRGAHNEQPEGQTDDAESRDVEPIPEHALPAVRATLRHVAERLAALDRDEVDIEELCALRRELIGQSPQGAVERHAAERLRLASDHPLAAIPAARRDEARAAVPPEWSNPCTFWSEVRRRTSVVVQPGADHGSRTDDATDGAREPWRFWHRLFHEALAAQALAERWTEQKEAIVGLLDGALASARRAAERRHLVPRSLREYAQREVDRTKGWKDWKAWCRAAAQQLGDRFVPTCDDLAERNDDDAWFDFTAESDEPSAPPVVVRIPGPTVWQEAAVFLARREGANELASLAAALEDRQFGRFLAHAKELRAESLGRLVEAVDTDLRRGLVLETALQHVTSRDAFESIRNRARERFTESGAWVWFVDEALREAAPRLEWAQDARRRFWEETIGGRPSTDEFVPIASGTFCMGSPDGEADAYDDEKPQHPVSITGFRIWRTPVTRQQYRRFDPKHEDFWSKEGGVPDDEQDDRPVTEVSWWAAMAYSRWLGYRLFGTLEGTLPSEAEWEYACRGMTAASPDGQTKWSCGDREEEVRHAAWYEGTPNVGGRVHRVAEKTPNGFGLYDMHGNVWEWCRDHWRPYRRSAELLDDPVGPLSGARRAVRGGSYWFDARRCRSAYRFWYHVGLRLRNQGFRPVFPAARG